MARRENNNLSLSDLLKTFVADNNLQKGLDKVQVQQVWEQVMGPAIMRYTQNIALKNDVLYVQLSSSVLREELSYGVQKIIKNLNETLGKELIKKLVLR